ncbi:uncharacterized protein LOC135490813 isoform X3 [Lineus longissimus]|uniref:uncharacterized protein LOC135490813 isoform X3 n=1 Tax=Lineus longissimus TaxID=88925 RepID=UPI002B4C999F
MGTNYHNEALRKQRVVDRQRESVMRMVNHDTGPESAARNELRSGKKAVEDVMAEADFRQATKSLSHNYHRHVDNTPVDKIYPIIQPECYPTKPLASRPMPQHRVHHHKV